MNKNKNQVRHLGLAVAITAIALGLCSNLNADTDAYSRSGGIWVRENASQSWNPVNPTNRDMIQFSYGRNEADAAILLAGDETAETKFRFVMPTSPPNRKAYQMMNRFLISGQGSWVRSMGSGRGSIDIGFQTTFTCQWRNTVRGDLGTGKSLSWKGRSQGKDPFHLLPENFSDNGITNDYHLFIPIGLGEGTTIGPSQGSVQWDVFYDTASTTTNLLSIHLDSEGMTTTSDSPTGLKFFELSSMNELPSELPIQLSLEDLQTMLENDFIGDLRLDSPVYIGIVWEDVPVPTVDLGNDAVARLRIEADVNDGAAAEVISFQNNIDDYNGLTDVLIGNDIDGGDGNVNGTNTEFAFINGLYGNSTDRQLLMNFADLENMIPPNARILDARLNLLTPDQPGAESDGPYAVSRLLAPFDIDSTYNGSGGYYFELGNADRAQGDGFVLGQPNQFSESEITEIVQAWVDGETNYGLVVSAGTQDDWSIYMSGVGNIGLQDPTAGPVIDVSFTEPPGLASLQPFTIESKADTQWDVFTVEPNTSTYQNGDNADPRGFSIVGGQNDRQVFIRPHPIFQSEGGQVPDNATIVDARLVLTTSPAELNSNVGTAGEYGVKPILSPWDPATPYPNINFGPFVDVATGMVADSVASFDVTPILREWHAGQNNNGFCISSLGSQDDWSIRLSSAGPNEVPKLLIKFTYEAEVVSPDSVVVTHGSSIGSELSRLSESDNQDFSVRRSDVDVQSRTCLELTGFSPFANPVAIELILENSVFARTDVNQAIEMWDYDSSSWELMDSRLARRFVDEVVTVQAEGDLSRFVEEGTQGMKARITMVSTNPRQRFTSNTDQFNWIID